MRNTFQWLEQSFRCIYLQVVKVYHHTMVVYNSNYIYSVSICRYKAWKVYRRYALKKGNFAFEVTAAENIVQSNIIFLKKMW